MWLTPLDRSLRVPEPTLPYPSVPEPTLLPAPAGGRRQAALLARQPRSGMRAHVSQPALERTRTQPYSAVSTVYEKRNTCSCLPTSSREDTYSAAFLSVVCLRCSAYAAYHRLHALMSAYSARRLAGVALVNPATSIGRSWPAQLRRLLDAVARLVGVSSLQQQKNRRSCRASSTPSPPSLRTCPTRPTLPSPLPSSRRSLEGRPSGARLVW